MASEFSFPTQSPGGGGGTGATGPIGPTGPAGPTGPTGASPGGVIPLPGAAGRVLYDDGAAWVALAAGLANQVLTSHGAAAPSWSDFPFATLAASYDGVDTYLIGRPVPLRDISGAMLRLYAHGGGEFWVAFNASFDGTGWTKDYAAGPSALHAFTYFGDHATYTQVDDPSVTTWNVWATYSRTDSAGETHNDESCVVQFGNEFMTPSGGYIGGFCAFRKRFNFTPSSFTFNVTASSRTTGDLHAVWATQVGFNWYTQLISGSGDAACFGTVTVSL